MDVTGLIFLLYFGSGIALVLVMIIFLAFASQREIEGKRDHGYKIEFRRGRYYLLKKRRMKL